MNDIITLARSSSNAIRSHGFPALEAGNISFPDGRYALDFEPGRDRASFIIKHTIEGAPLITRLLTEQRAQYVCAVSSPISSYRRTHISSTSSQTICWNMDDLGEPPLFTPMIVSVDSCKLQLDQNRDGIHEIWHKQSVSFAKGVRLALGPVVQLQSSVLELLSLHADQTLEDGMFLADAETEHGFRFRVNLNPRLHEFLRYSGGNITRKNIMTHIVTACLALLQRDFNKDDDDDDGWRSHRNLRTFADFLENKGLPIWTDDEFRPEKVAMSLYPHTLPQEQDGEDE